MDEEVGNPEVEPVCSQRWGSHLNLQLRRPRLGPLDTTCPDHPFAIFKD